MADIRTVTPTFAVAPQIMAEDMAEIAAAGFKTVINNRPDGEVPDQLTDVEARAEAAKLGLTYVAIPFAGGPRMEEVEATMAALAGNPGPILAFCRSGTRSITVWALAQAASGVMAPAAIVEAAAEAGYDLSPYLLTFSRLAGANE